MPGNEQALIDSFGDWAEGSQAKCVEVLEEKGIDGDLDALCAWMKDEWSGSTDWRGKGKGGQEPGSNDVSVPKAIGAIKLVGGQPAKVAFKKGDKVAVHIGPQTSTGTVQDDAADGEKVKVKHDDNSAVDFMAGKTRTHDHDQVKKASEYLAERYAEEYGDPAPELRVAAEKGANKADFAYTPTDNEADWKLDVSSAKNAAGAAAALSPGGFRGQKADIPAAALAAVKAKVRAAYKKFFPDKDPADYPDSIKATEDGGSQEPADDPEQSEDKSYDSAKVYLGKMFEVLKPTVTKEQWDKAVRTARSHAGGKAPRAKAAYDPYGMQPVTYDSNGDSSPGMDADADEEAGNWDEDSSVIPDTLPKLSKGDGRVEYRAADQVGKQCGSCKFVDDDCDACVLVEGVIQASGVCNLWTDPAQTYHEGGNAVVDLIEAAARDSGARWRLFFELQKVAGELPTRIPYLPKPGTYSHPQWGTIAITKERNQHFVENFTKGIYQTPIPLDAEHQTKVSGAMAWIKNLILNEDGSVDADNVEWTDRGRAMVEGGRFKFVSPEWYDEWEDPATQKVYTDVAIGGALTTRPFFKDGPLAGLRPLMAASEGLMAPTDWVEGAEKVTFAPLRRGSARVGEPPQNQPRQAPRAGGNGPMAIDAKAFAELQRKVDGQDGQLRQMSDNLRAATERAENLEAQLRAKEFAEVAGGHRGHQAWTGDPAKNVAQLEKLAKAFGQDSQEFKDYVAQRDQDADAIHKAGLFNEQGRPGAGRTTDGMVAVEEEARKLAAEPSSSKTYEMAFSEVISRPEHIEVYNEYMRSKGLTR